MRKVLFVTDSLGPGGAAKQLTLLATGLPRDRIEGHVCALGRGGGFSGLLHEAGVAVSAMGWTRRLDLPGLLSFRRLVREFDPDIIHAWSPRALWAVRMVAGRARRNGRR